MTTTYDHPVRSMDDPIVKRIYEGASRFANSLAPGVYTVEALPWLNNLPLWLPGMHWKREVLEWAEEDVGLYKEMVDLTKQKIVSMALLLFIPSTKRLTFLLARYYSWRIFRSTHARQHGEIQFDR